jgi:hypothetical protein
VDEAAAGRRCRDAHAGGARRGVEQEVAVVGVKGGEEGVAGGGVDGRVVAEDAERLLGPGDLVGADVPQPAAHVGQALDVVEGRFALGEQAADADVALVGTQVAGAQRGDLELQGRHSLGQVLDAPLVILLGRGRRCRLIGTDHSKHIPHSLIRRCFAVSRIERQRRVVHR